MKTVISKNLTALLLVLLVTLLTFLSSPFSKKLIGDDSGVFLYSAWRMLHGDVLYKDLWDHKPPLIHFINVVALVFNQKTLWGLWFIQLFYLVSATLIGFEVLFLCFGLLPATIASVAWILSPAIVLGDGNHTQDYALFYQFAILFLYIKKSKGHRALLYSYLIGVCGGIICLLQPNITTIYISVLLYECISVFFKKTKLIPFILNIFGLGSPFVFMGIYFYRTQSLYEFYQAVVVYNRYYSSTTPAHLFLSIYTGLLLNLLSGLLLFTVLGVIISIKNNILKTAHGSLVIVKVALIALPVEVTLTTISGRDALHYYTSWLPVFSVFAAYCVWRITNRFPVFNHTIVIATILIIMSIGPLYTITTLTKETNDRNTMLSRKHQKIVAYLEKNTTEKDTILLWGVEPRINFLAKRKSASRFAYQFALFTKHYSTPQLIDTFISDLKRNRPKYIIDAPIYKGYMPALDKKIRATWKIPLPNYSETPEVNRVYRYIESQYRYERTIEDWTVYRRKN